MPIIEKTLRRNLRKQGFGLRKSRSRTPENPELGQYHIFDIERNFVVAGAWPLGFSLSLEDAAQWLSDQPK